RRQVRLGEDRDQLVLRERVDEQVHVPGARAVAGADQAVAVAEDRLADAAAGEVVRVENLSSRRVLSGVVAAPGEVRVSR
ncbi:MAG TPA: flagella basal body P-ring formation protein FlgA, partial [Xanthomonadaceae bacterium]|nr:flagella basal body P-ring formation protein FlgA [Xanthomonadaceae bacterium]